MDSLALAYYGGIKEYEWRHVSIIVQNENIFTMVRLYAWDDTVEGRTSRDQLIIEAAPPSTN